MKIAVIGGGAAGFFSAITAKETYPHSHVVIFEKSSEVLSKVKISGGGRCNVTHACSSVADLCKGYPRGGKLLKKIFYKFNHLHTMAWFEERGVPLVVQQDNCVFPKSQSSQSIIGCFVNQAYHLGIEIRLKTQVQAVEVFDSQFVLKFLHASLDGELFDKVIVTTGGTSNEAGYEWLKKLGHVIEKPIPSLFTFSLSDREIRTLMGVVVENALVRIQGTKIQAQGDLLITHWGLSGPAILQLSSYAARMLHDADYSCTIHINWVQQQNTDLVLQQLQEIADLHAHKQVHNYRPFDIPSRLWEYIVRKSELAPQKKWGEIGKKGLQRIGNFLTNDQYEVSGKTPFREEFVTCGGVSLQSVNLDTMESKVCKHLYFAGEVLDIDGITGGFNFQNAWTTGFIAGKLQ